jgi:hypothetical protein
MKKYLYLGVRVNLHRLMLGCAVWLGETAYFGWNMTAQSPAEHWMDLFSLFLMILAFEVKKLRSGMVILIRQPKENDSGNESD